MHLKHVSKRRSSDDTCDDRCQSLDTKYGTEYFATFAYRVSVLSTLSEGKVDLLFPSSGTQYNYFTDVLESFCTGCT